MQTYAEYLETMRAYCFYPSSFECWKGWQLHWHGCYKTDQGLLNESGAVIEIPTRDGFGRTINSGLQLN